MIMAHLVKGGERMKEFKEDKKELEYKIAQLLIEFSKKYDVRIKDIDLKDFNTFVDCCKYIVNIEVDL